MSFSRTRLWDGKIPGTHEPGFVEAPLVEFDPPGELAALKNAAVLVRTFGFGECHVILSREDPDDQGLRWHLSISHPERHPSWDEIKTVRYRICGPDIGDEAHGW
jgi:hypothetical protein